MSFKTHRKDKGADSIRKVVNELKNKTQPFVAVGVMGEKQHRGGDITMPTLAAIHEFGTEDGHIPARSFMRTTFKEQFQALKKLTAEMHHDVIFKKKTIHEALSLIGEKYAAAIKAKITAGIPPPNAESTIARKGSSTPLIDTGQLLNSITYKVHEHGGGHE